MLFLPRFQRSDGGKARKGSPSGGSILVTSAPKSDRTIVAMDPAIPQVKSRTIRPSRTSVMVLKPVRANRSSGQVYSMRKFRVKAVTGTTKGNLLAKVNFSHYNGLQVTELLWRREVENGKS